MKSVIQVKRLPVKRKKMAISQLLALKNDLVKVVLQSRRYEPVVMIRPASEVILGPNLSMNIPGRNPSPRPMFIMEARTSTKIKPHHEKTCLCGFGAGPTYTGLHTTEDD